MPLQAQPVEMDEARELLRSAGLRCTAARLAVLQHLRQVQAPVSHAEVAEKLVPLGFDKATVFAMFGSVKTAPERFEPRTVTAEPLDGTHVAVTSGLKTGDRVAVRAATLINQIR